MLRKLWEVVITDYLMLDATFRVAARMMDDAVTAMHVIMNKYKQVLHFAFQSEESVVTFDRMLRQLSKKPSADQARFVSADNCCCNGDPAAHRYLREPKALPGLEACLGDIFHGNTAA